MNHCLYLEPSAKRTFIALDSLKRTDVASYYLLAELLLSHPKLSKETSLDNLAGLKLVFKPVLAGSDNFIFYSSLSQVVHPSLAYLFVDPYKKGREIFEEILRDGYSVDNLRFENTKAALLYKLETRGDKEALDMLKSSINCLLASPYIDKQALKNITVSQVKQAFEALKANTCGETYYCGKKLKKEVSLESKYREEIKLLAPLKTEGEVTIKVKDIASEAIAFIFEVPEMRTVSDLNGIESYLKAISLAYRDYGLRRMGVSLDPMIAIIDNTHAAIIISASFTKANYLRQQGPLKVSEPYKVEVSNFFEEASSYSKKKQLELLLDDSRAIDRFLTCQLLKLEGEDIFTVEVKREQLEAMNEQAHLVASVSIEGEHDDQI